MSGGAQNHFIVGNAIRSIFLCAITLPLAAHAHQVIGITDGDTMTLLVDRKPLKIRLANIDAPEKKQAFGQKSKESLSSLCWGKDAQYQAKNIDRYGRTVAVVRCAGVEANRAQVERGMAWVYGRYNKDSSLPALEQAARAGKIGLWADAHPMAPWDFRHPIKVAQDTTCYVGPKGGRYLLINGRKRYGC